MDYLYRCRHTHIAELIEEFVPSDSSFSSSSEDRRPSFRDKTLGMMCQHLEYAIAQGHQLRLGVPWNPWRTDEPCRAIFIWEAAGWSQSKYVFTSFQERGDMGDVDHQVSMAIDLEASHSKMPMPRLYTRHWILGVCNFKNLRRHTVVFPWPPGLSAIKA